MRIKVLLVILSFLVLNGCASTGKLASTPSLTQDFSQDLGALKNKFSDIELYRPIQFSWKNLTSFDELPPRPPLSEVSKKLGPADKKSKNWMEWMGLAAFNIALGSIYGTWGASAIAMLIFIAPAETHVWEKGNKRVTARVDAPGVTGYQKRMAYWEWKEVDNQVLSMDAVK